MKRISIIIAALMAGVAFIACDKKPLNDAEIPVVIPDGIYEETVHYIVNEDNPPYNYHKDTVISTIVIIEDSKFIYPFLCQDSSWHYTQYADGTKRDSSIYYNGHFIFNANAYCTTAYGHQRTHPKIEMLRNGMIIMSDILIRYGTFLSFSKDTTYAVVLNEGDKYIYQYDRVYRLEYASQIYKVENKCFHTLIRANQ